MEAALLSATAIFNQDQTPGKTAAKSSSPATFPKLLSALAQKGSVPAVSSTKTAGTEQGKKSDSPDNVVVQTLLSVLLQQLPTPSQDNLNTLLSADPNTSSGETGQQTIDLSALGKLLQGFSSTGSATDPLSQLLESIKANTQQDGNGDPSGNTAAQALLMALMQYLPGQSQDSLKAMLTADPNEWGIKQSGQDSNALAELLTGSAGSNPILQRLLNALEAGDKTATGDTKLSLQSQAQSMEVKTATPPGAASVPIESRPTTDLTKNGEPVLQQSASGDAVKPLMPGSMTLAQQPTSADGQALQKTQSQESPLLKLEKANMAKWLQDYLQPTRLSDQKVTAFSAQPAALLPGSPSAGTGASNASAAGDGTLASKVIGQIVDNAQLALKGSNPSMSIQLKPDFLGDLRLVVEVEHGIVNAHFVAQNQTTANLIAARLPELRQALNSQGVSWQHLSVSCNAGQGNSQGTSSQSQQQTGQSQMQFASGYDGGASIDDPQMPQAYQWAGTGALNCII